MNSSGSTRRGVATCRADRNPTRSAEHRPSFLAKPGSAIDALSDGGCAVTVARMSAAIVIALTFLLAGLVKGFIGLGLPTVAVGLLTLVMKPAQAAALLVVPSLVTNVWQLLAGPRFGGLLRRLWGMMVGIC